MPTPETTSVPSARRRLDRAQRGRIIISVVGAVALPAVVLRGGDGPFSTVAAAGCALLLLLTAIQTWYFGTAPTGRITRWEVVLTWAPIVMMVLLLVLLFASMLRL